ncbi:Hypothetical protein CINCED_3A002986 [Cinara cedri]|nr:Hypothetical protein CINCED_3A002986 [Cinara cedri]
MIIHKSTNIRRLVLPTPIIHQDQESVFVPMRVTQNKTLELYNPSMDVREKTQTTFEQTIKIKKEPESDNEGDINNDGIEEFVEHEQLEEEIIQNFSGDIKETVQGNKFCWNYFDGIRMVTFNPVLSIKQEPMNEEFSEKSLEDTRPTFDPNISIKQEPLTEETPERSFEDTRPTFDPNINIKQEPISERAEDIENARIIQKCYDYGKFIEGKLKAFSATTRETVLFEFAKVISKAHDGFYE